MTVKFETLSHQALAQVCGEILDEPVIGFTQPGGKKRRSIRVQLQDRSVIATQRPNVGRAMMELQILRALHSRGAPVPEVLAHRDNIVLQEDMGSYRLSEAMQKATPSEQLDVASRAIESLLKTRRVARRLTLERFVPRLGYTKKWVGAFADGPADLSRVFDFDPPEFDRQAVGEALLVPAEMFVKWDARPGNAMMTPAGTVCWIDWEHCGRRQGMEDFAWLMGDEFWPLDPVQMIALLAEQLPRQGTGRKGRSNLEYLQLFAVFYMAQRLALIFRRIRKKGWGKLAQVTQFDDVGTVPELACRLCRHGALLAETSPLTRSLAPWFADCSVALLDFETP